MAFQRPFRIVVLCAALVSGVSAQTLILTSNLPSLSAQGGTITFTASIAYTTKPATLGLSLTLPTGWAFVSGTSVTGTSEPSVVPLAGSTDLLEWAFVNVPNSPMTFTFTMSYPSMTQGLQSLTSSMVARDGLGGSTIVTGPTVALPGGYNTVAWNGGTGNWSDGTQWTPGIVPNNANDTHYTASVSAGVATLASSVILDDLFFNGGTINGAGTLTLTGMASNWTLGNFAGTGELVIAAGAQLVASGTGLHDFGERTIRNNGLFVWTGGTTLQSGNGGAFVNSSTGTFVDATAGTGEYQITNSGGGSFTFSNAGTYSKSTATVTRITVPFTNTGNIYVSAGTLRFSNTFTQAAPPVAIPPGTAATATSMNGSGNIMFVAQGATLQFDNGLNFATGMLFGGGAIVGNVANSGFVSPGSMIGTLTIQGNLTLLATSQLQFDIAGNVKGTTYDFLSVNGTATLGGGFAFSMLPGAETGIAPTDALTLLTATSLTGTFANLPNGTRLLATTGIGSFVINYSTTSVTLTDFQPIPEPATWTLMITGSGFVLFAARRQRRRSRRD